MISVLCVNRNSHYKSIPGLDCYDLDRDCRTFPGGNPIICHPPCRHWSAFTRHQATGCPSEKELAWFCFDMLLQYGGILEHPAFSHFLRRFWPGEVKIIEVHQSWWGFPMRKRTWLMMPSSWNYELPFDLLPDMNYSQSKVFSNLTTSQRSATTPSLAKFLIETVRLNT